MKILFDHQIFNRQRFGGISRYFANIYETIHHTPHITAELSILYSENYYIRDFDGILSNRLGELLLSKESRCNKWNKNYSRYLINQNNFDVLHPTYFHPYFLKYLKRPFILTVHDMTYESIPQYFPSTDALPYQKRLLMERADKIIAISETTKADILKYSHVKEDKIEVIYHGIEQNAPTYEEVINLPSEYILYVGDRQGYKNFHIVVQAFKILSLGKIAHSPNL